MMSDMGNNYLLNTDQIVKNYLSEFKTGNIMSAPRIKHITISSGCGKFHKETAKVNAVLDDMTKIAGQKAILSKAKKSISNFKIREGMTSGCYVTLRGRKMYSFLDVLTTIALPRIPDFTGFTIKSFANNKKEGLKGRMSFNIGIKSHHIFPSVNVSEKLNFGLNISICIEGTNTKIEDVLDLLKEVGLPFRDDFKSERTDS